MRKDKWNADLRSLRRVRQVRSRSEDSDKSEEDPSVPPNSSPIKSGQAGQARPSVTGDTQPTEMGVGYGTRSVPTTIDPTPTTFDPAETTLLSDLFDAPSRFGVSMSLYR